jgi:hypothetical protein
LGRTLELGRSRRTIGSCGRPGAGFDGVVGGAGRAQRATGSFANSPLATALTMGLERPKDPSRDHPTRRDGLFPCVLPVPWR